jgi:hypothetical protein
MRMLVRPAALLRAGARGRRRDGGQHRTVRGDNVAAASARAAVRLLQRPVSTIVTS